MKAIILAAGMGTRISKYIEEKPKCMVDIGGMTLLEYTIDLLHSRNIGDIVVCVGYQAEYIRSAVRDTSVKYVYNPFYDVTNGIASIWFARDFLDEAEETLIMSGDVYMEPEIIDALIAEKRSPVLLADSSRIIEADFRFHYENDILKKYGKDLSIEETTGECVGAAKLGRDFVGKYKAHMLEMIDHQVHSVWWESVMYDMIPETDIYVCDIAGSFWAEVDFIEDYKRILARRKENHLLDAIVGTEHEKKN